MPSVARFRLRYQATDLEMPLGEFVIGRSSSCSLALDDALVSRRHAILRVSTESVTVEDLGSRNGVNLNGQKIVGTARVRHLDRVSIGGQDMIVMEVGRQARERPTSEFRVCLSCNTPLEATASHCSRCGARIPGGAATLAGATLEIRLDADPSEVSGAFRLIASIADKALALGQFEDAERMLGQHLDALVAGAQLGRKTSDLHLAQGTDFALALAEGLGSARWLDWAFDIHAANRQLMPSATIERLHELVRKVRYSTPTALRAYIAVLAELGDSLTPAERFQVRRLEGLERVVVA